jgi:lysophospholipase L1-like esterase
MNIHLIGDSTIQYNDIRTYPQTGWGQMLPLMLKPEYGFKVFNHAKNGMSSKSFYDFGLFIPVVQALKAGDLLLIQFGHNDQKEDLEKKTDPYSTYQMYLRKYITAAKEVGATPILITSLARRQFDASGSLLNSHGDFPDAMRVLSKRESVLCIDLNALSMMRISDVGDFESRKWFMHLPLGRYPNYPDGLSDNTHLTPEGAVVFAAIVAGALKTCLDEVDVDTDFIL